MRHRIGIQDLGALAGLLLVLAYVAFEIEVFRTEGAMSDAQRRIALNESLLLGGILVLGLLIFAIRRYRDLRSEIARRSAAECKARELAYRDPLTGLANRREFEDSLRRAAAAPPEAGCSHAVFLLDLNGFKQINDTYGHGVGDEVLVICAQRLMSAVRQDAFVARIGGDEFVILAEHLLGPEAAASIAMRILHRFERPVATGHAEHPVSVGIGIALMPGDAQEAEEALRKADVALYRAKAERRSAFRFFEEEMDRLLREREAMERDLKRAMQGGRIEPRYRPSFDLGTGGVVGFEAVPCWTGDSGEEIPPERFLPIAQETGLIHELAAQVLEAACRAATRWPDAITLSMDVLPGQIKDRNLGQSILATLERTGLDPRRFEVEIAESTIVHDLEAAKAALGPLRSAGVGIALDNFGTGYSNLYHMREFRIDKVKIARRLVENMGEEEADRMVRALAGLGHGLGLAVSADGLDNTEELGLLLASGVREGQGSGELVTGAEADRLVSRVPA
ncbi:putative bifunctional diguanylate cyclase/phosphodiesterase [Aureimonas populi]|uniref:Bifunctional diguanylate cyclase/phosphodiesterase n=1 Tax=Aureimonas populi TaxID=1701758 RepID=A0ABW5CIL8_9HYPH|nr:EAL domain-containing protein [Aureimonas populi]